MRRAHLLRGIGITVLCAAALAACGSNRSATTTKGAKSPPRDTHTVDIYSSLPLDGPQKAESEAIMSGIRYWLSLGNSHVASYTIRYIPRNDASQRTGSWSAQRTVTIARQAAQDPHAIAYIGDLDSGATELSLPILNQAGMVQITPGSGYPGLTNSVPPVTQSGEPARFYPNRNSHTLLRLIPSDLVEASAALDKLKSTQCVHVAAVAFGGGAGAKPLVTAVAETAKLYNMVYVPPPKGGVPGTNTKLYSAYVSAMRSLGVGCFVLTGRVTPAAIALTKAIHEELPAGYIVGTTGFCNRGWLGSGANAIPEPVEHFLYCASPVLPLAKYPGSKPLVAHLEKLYGKHLPLSAWYAVYGYQAAEMVGDAIPGLDGTEDNRKWVLQGLIGGGPRSSSLIGPFSFDANGNLLSHKYGMYTLKNGRLTYSTTLDPLLTFQ
ncbi:MAG TPA: ABC transporter substrate-binding protein [Solirubrobacteraceae bacterium]|jgi:branched-chain amino acid transport system substrate-binding protein|nr:ABC transporter substrate-binding protein [Solirubrobacteraceae bacterium]